MDEAYTFEQKQPQKALQLYTKSHQLSLKFNYKEGAYKSLLYSGIVYSNMTIRNLYLLLYCLIFEPESKSTCYEFA